MICSTIGVLGFWGAMVSRSLSDRICLVRGAIARCADRVVIGCTCVWVYTGCLYPRSLAQTNTDVSSLAAG